MDEMKIFIDYGHDTIKCCHVNPIIDSEQSYKIQQKVQHIQTEELDHIEIPTFYAQHLLARYRQEQVSQAKQSKSNKIDPIDFRKDKLDEMIKQINSEYCINALVGDQFYQESHIKSGILSSIKFKIQDEKGKSKGLDCMSGIVKHAGNFLWQKHSERNDKKKEEKKMIYSQQQSLLDSSMSTFNNTTMIKHIQSNNLQDLDLRFGDSTTLLMTDGSITMAGGDQNLLTNSMKQREQICECAFEQWNVQKFGFTTSQTAMLVSQLQHTGVVVDFGHEMTQIVPIEFGHANYNKCQVLPIGGRHIDRYMQLKMNGLEEKVRENQFYTQVIKCQFKENLPEEVDVLQVILPDDKAVKIDRGDKLLTDIIQSYYKLDLWKKLESDLIRHPFNKDLKRVNQSESIFKKQNENKLKNYLVQKVMETILGTDGTHFQQEEDAKQAKLLNVIRVSGGGSLLPQITTNFQKGHHPTTLGQIVKEELNDNLTGIIDNLDVMCDTDPKLSVLQGGRIIMNLQSFDKMMLSKKQYDEEGASMINFRSV